jgi:23S rRNA (cytosine1962-C5)-methyltransferase
MAFLILKSGREKSLLRRHPWLFSGAIAAVQGEPAPGETIEIKSAQGVLLGHGAYSPHSQITVRVWTFDPNQEVTSAFIRDRLERAVRLRDFLKVLHPQGACRIIHAESDGLPGLVVDRYADYLVCQFLTAGAEYWKEDILAHLKEIVPVTGIYERSDVDVRLKEGLTHRTGLLYGEEPPELVMIEEGPCRFAVDIRRGHKTGFYLDQRENRGLLTPYVQRAEILNCFAYTGAFGIWALKGGAARVANLESSSEALALARHNAEINALDPAVFEHTEGDVFHVLREYRDSERRFDLIILDPPKFVETQSQLERASRGYKDINWLAFRILRPGGVLFTFSCSGLMPFDLFQKIVADAALDAGRDAQIIQRLTQSADHPVALNFPEGAYLKGLVCKAW